MIPLTDLKSREGIGAWLEANGMTGEGVEIGVYEGGYAQQILSTWTGTLHLVDPWAAQDPAVYVESSNIDFAAVEAVARSRMLPFGPRAVFHKQTSDAAFNAADLIFNWMRLGRRFVFGYLDGNHSGDQVKRDIEQWWTLIQPGGVMGGHDFFEGEEAEKYWHCKDIAPAVRAFVATHGLELHLTTADWPVSWWVKKPLAVPMETV